MQVYMQERGDALYIRPSGELDEHTSASARRYVDEGVRKYARVKKVVFDLSEVSFMDSTGIGFLIGRYKTISKIGLPVYITSPNQDTDRLLLLGGIYAVIPKV